MAGNLRPGPAGPGRARPGRRGAQQRGMYKNKKNNKVNKINKDWLHKMNEIMDIGFPSGGTFFIFGPLGDTFLLFYFFYFFLLFYFYYCFHLFRTSLGHRSGTQKAVLPMLFLVFWSFWGSLGQGRPSRGPGGDTFLLFCIYIKDSHTSFEKSVTRRSLFLQFNLLYFPAGI